MQQEDSVQRRARDAGPNRCLWWTHPAYTVKTYMKKETRERRMMLCRYLLPKQPYRQRTQDNATATKRSNCTFSLKVRSKKVMRLAITISQTDPSKKNTAWEFNTWEIATFCPTTTKSYLPKIFQSNKFLAFSINRTMF